LVVVVTLNFFGVGFVGLCLSFILQIFKPWSFNFVPFLKNSRTCEL
jgi:hypothetical protein